MKLRVKQSTIALLCVFGILVGGTVILNLISPHDSVGSVTLTQPEESMGLTTNQEMVTKAVENYFEASGFSEKYIINQLTSENGDGFNPEDVDFVLAQLNIDWNEQAVRVAKRYLETEGFSRVGLVNQLSSPYGDQFTRAQAEYAADKVGL